MTIPKFMLPLQPLAQPRGQRRRVPALADRRTAALGGAPSRSGKLNSFVMQPQVQTQWCWAAVSASVANFYRQAAIWTPCSVATGLYRSRNVVVNCCTQAANCNHPDTLDDPLMMVGHYGGRRDNRVPINQVVAEIGRGRPFGVRISWRGNGGHFVVIGGWSVAPDNVTYVDVFDPWYSFVQLPVDQFATRYREIGQWRNSYFTVPGAALGGGRAREKSIRRGAPLSA